MLDSGAYNETLPVSIKDDVMFSHWPIRRKLILGVVLLLLSLYPLVIVGGRWRARTLGRQLLTGTVDCKSRLQHHLCLSGQRT